jgi:predicted nucleic acid-binding protein
MRRVFADTSFYVAMLNTNDACHDRANVLADQLSGEIITTEYIVIELGNWLSRSVSRGRFSRLFEGLHADPQIIIVPAERSLLNEGVDLYALRSDKQWSLTDCISFVVMSRFEVTDALTSDHHFRQAGFNALLA